MEYTRLHDLGGLLEQVWQQQRQYNEQVKGLQTEKQNWAEVYLLGMVGEVKEILDELQWKRHRVSETRPLGFIRENVADELADTTKYVLCLWQEFGFSPEQMLGEILSKGLELDYKLRTEYFPQSGRRFIVTDLDGTGADYRKGWEAWWGRPDEVKTLNVDLDNGVPFEEYRRSKTEFEAAGGYAHLPLYVDWAVLVRSEQQAGSGLLVTTARPAHELRRIWQDTMSWLSENGIVPDSIVFGRDERIVELLKLGRQDNEVVLLEDDATLAMRAAQNGIHVMLKTQNYNLSVQHPLIQRYETFPTRVPWEQFYPEVKEVVREI